MTEIPGEGSGDDEGHEGQHDIAAADELEDFLHRCAIDFADAYFLATVLGLEHGEAEHTDEGDEQTDEREADDLADEAVLFLIEFFQTLVDVFDVHLTVRVEAIDDFLNLPAHLALVGIGGYANVQHVILLPPLGIFLVGDEEGECLLIAALTGGEKAHVLANTHHGVLVVEHLLTHFHPSPLLAGCLVDDVTALVVLVEVATLDNGNAHGAQVVVINEETGKMNLVVVVATPPAHVTVLCGDDGIGVAGIFHARELEQLGPQGIVLLAQRFVRSDIGNFVLGKTVVAGVDIMTLQVENADIDDHHRRDEQLQTDETGAQLAAAGRESEGAFQGQGGRKAGHETCGIETGQYAYEDAEADEQQDEPDVVAQQDAALKHLSESGPHGEQPHGGYGQATG